MSLGSEKSSSGPSESESSAGSSEESSAESSAAESSSAGMSSSDASSGVGGSSSGDDDGPPWPPDDGGSSSSSSSGSNSSEGNPFGVMIIDLIGVNGLPDFWQLGFLNVPEHVDEAGGTSPVYLIEMPPPGPDSKRFAVRLDNAYEAGVISTEADLEVLANNTLGRPEPFPGIWVTVSYNGESDSVQVESVTPASGLQVICAITVLADGTFTMS
jgi:hypothetical protein